MPCLSPVATGLRIPPPLPPLIIPYTGFSHPSPLARTDNAKPDPSTPRPSIMDATVSPALPPSSLLHLHFVIDRSGSMSERVQQVETGYKEFLQHQKSIQTPEIPVLVSTLFFNHEVTVVVESIPLKDAIDLQPGQYQPRSSTALRDAMGETLIKIKASLAVEGGEGSSSTAKHIVIVLTDGLENSSKHVSPTDLARLIEETKTNVEIVYMGSNQDAILQGMNVGANRDTSLTYTDSNLLTAIRSTTNAVGRMRSGESSTIQYTNLERDSSMGGRLLPRMRRHVGRLEPSDLDSDDEGEDGYSTDDTVILDF